MKSIIAMVVKNNPDDSTENTELENLLGISLTNVEYVQTGAVFALTKRMLVFVLLVMQIYASIP